jgi:signal peptide peptidase SppA
MNFSNLWAIRPEAAPTVAKLVTFPEAVAAAGRWEALQPSVRGAGANKTAHIPIQGILTNDGPAYFGSNYQTISDAVERAAADPDVKRIVLSVDSPGGDVVGLPEAGAVIAAAAKVKPVSAIVEGASASAAYWLTSQASDITLTPSGEVGSVGVRMMHIDVSKALDNDGVKITELHSGDFKTEWSPYSPLSDGAKADMQTRLDAMHNDFLKAVATGRQGRATPAMVKARFGEGRMHSAKDALAGGLVDKVQPSREFYRSLATTSTTPVAPSFGIRRARLELERAKVVR